MPFIASNGLTEAGTSKTIQAGGMAVHYHDIGSGEPVLFLADHPVTGGYPVVAVVLDADVDRAAQVRPGQTVRFTLVRG